MVDWFGLASKKYKHRCLNGRLFLGYKFLFLSTTVMFNYQIVGLGLGGLDLLGSPKMISGLGNLEVSRFEGPKPSTHSNHKPSAEC